LLLCKDNFSNYLGIKIQTIKKGFCALSLEINSQFVNGFEIAHGGITYSLADTALAFASNGYGLKCVSIETSISHVRPVFTNDILYAKCSEKYRGKKIGVYEVEIVNQNLKIVALFKGTVHISEKEW
jgi:acyl-CoA thioesterase